MIPGHRFWILIWLGILCLGILGFIASIYWGRKTEWKNIDELLRAIGTITCSFGMLLLLKDARIPIRYLGQVFLVIALVCFVAAFIVGRRHRLPEPERDD
ncbi:MAG: hypothetical protein ACOY71_00330 [Gemmatimonadota bacterium]